MKTIGMLCLLLAFAIPETRADTVAGSGQGTLPPATDFAVVERGANHRVWEKTTYELGPNGLAIPQKHRYTELATGMHYQKNGQWVESQEIIEPYPAGAIARQGQYQVIFANNLNSYAAIDQQTPDGKRIRSNILGLEYYDRASGKSALIAQVKDSQGELISASQVLYPDSFQGVKADVRYTYKKDAFEQDVILREQPPTPEAYGLDSKTTVLEVLTEFLNPPAATVTHNTRPNSGLTDDSVNWGVMRLGHGRVFDLGGSGSGPSKAPVYKQYFNIQGRQILLEEVPVEEIRSGLSGLPEQSSIPPAQLPRRAVKERALPPSLLARAKVGAMKLATTDLSNRGFVLDYVQLNTSVTNYTFQADTTYYISGTVNVSGSTVLEGGTVIKYASSGAKLVPDASQLVTCQTGPYRPAILTSKDDDTVGDSISGSTGSPTTNSDTYISYLDNGALTHCSLNYIRASYAGCAIADDFESGWVQLAILNSQFIKCTRAIYGYAQQLALRNDLFERCLYDVDTEAGADIQLTHVTVDQAWVFCNDSGGFGAGYIELTNSIFSNVTNALGLGTNAYPYTASVILQNSLIAGTNNRATIVYSGSSYQITNAAGLYQTAGAGSYYLATNSPYRGVGTANIDPYVWAELPAKTTVPPLVYSNLTLSVVTNYSARGIGDTNAAPDLGYHYDVLDYAFGGVTCYSNMTFNAGTAIGWFEPSSNYGISFYDHAVASFNGTATAPCVVARYSSVQEGGNGLWKGKGSTGGIIAQSLSGGYSMSPTNAAQAVANFTHFYLVAGGPNHFRELNALIKVTLNNCEFYGPGMGGYWDYYYMTNCLFERMRLAITGGNAALATMQNCTLHGTTMDFEYPSAQWPLTILNSSFDSCVYSAANTNAYTYADYNAFATNQARLAKYGVHDVTVTNFNWQTSWFGNYYLPTTSPLINAGNTNASLLALYHFTTQTNQTVEGNTIVDIGYHYVATDAYGNPLDTNGDGIVDYIEDANGNGIVDAGELSWTNLDMDGDGMPNAWELSHGLNPFDPTDALQDPDYDGRNNLQEYRDGTDPHNSQTFGNVCLASWSFNNTNSWAGDGGQLPLLATNVTGLPSWDTNAVRIDSTNGAILSYRDVETNGNANINLRNGTVCLWFKPDWRGANQGGTGPGSYGRLIELGSNNPVLVTNSWAVSTANGWWSLYLSADGNQIAFGSSTNGYGRVNLAAPASLVSTQWYQIALTYTPTNSILYLNGQYITNGLGSVYFPNLSERSAGFRIGSDFRGTNQAKGAFESLNTFNYPLSASAISSNYLAAIHADKNGNGLPDLWEWNNFGYEGVDPDGDPTGDGISNLQKYQDSLDPHQFIPTRLGYWQFNDAPNWLDTNGLAPMAASGLYPVSSWSGDAVRLTSDLTSQLGYPGVRTNGSAVAVCPAGTGSIRFWFKPEWSSYDGNQGTGPRSNIRLFEIGRDTTNAAYGLFALSVNSLGNNITFATEANGLQTNNLTGSISFSTNSWYQLVLTYTSTNSILYLNGLAFITNGLGVTNLPSQAVLQAGFYFGSSWDGSSQANGEFDELETFNYPLSAADIATNYANIMSVLAADGLPAVVANGLGLRLDAVDSTCDGLPDTWKLAHEINPNNPGPVTPQLIAQYVQDGPVGTTNAVTVAETNLINIYFSSYSTNVYGVPITGATVNNGSSNIVWNFCTMQSDYTNNGVSLADAAGNSVNVRLFAFIGPCKTPFAAVPTADDWESASFVTGVSGLTVPYGLTYSNYINNIHEPLDLCPDCHETYNLYSDPTRVGLGSTAVEGPSRTISTTVGGGSQTISGYWENIHKTNYIFGCGCISNTQFNCDHIWIRQVITEISVYVPGSSSYGGTVANTGLASPLTMYFGGGGGFDINQINNSGNNPDSYFQGPFYQLDASKMSQILAAVNSATLYNNSLITYIAGNPGLVASTNTDPVEWINCFLSPFSAINNNGYSLSGASGSGATWVCPGITNTATGAGPISNTDTNGSSGAWLKKMYPDAKRTLLLSGVSAGNYDVYVYYTCPTNAAPATVNGGRSFPGISPSGARYWYANVDAVSIPAPASYDDCVNASMPPWALPNATNCCIQIDVDSPDVPDSAADVHIIGLQIVGHTNAVFTSAILQAKPGNESAYLMWRAPAAATNFNIYRSVGASNSWTLLAATNVLNYQDAGLTEGTNYYYKVVGVEAGGTAEPASGVVEVTPFGCAPPLPPRIDYVAPLQIPVVNSAYEVSYQTLLTNSDAFDPQGWSLQFKVDSVSSGTLMVNGQPFTLANNTIGTNDSVVWIPPVNAPAPGTPSFRVYVADSLNRSAKTVEVKIKQRIKTYLLSWGNSYQDNELVEGSGCGSLGNGTVTYPGANSDTMYYMFQNQNRFGVLPFDPTWKLNDSVWGGLALGDPVHRVSNIDSATSISFFGSLQGHCAVTSDQRLWFWGGAESWAIGRPMALEYAPGNVSYFGDVAINWDSSQLTYDVWGPLWLNELVPVPVNDPATRSPMTDVVVAQGLFILKTDGSLWSFGCYKPLLGRDPESTADRFNHGTLGTCGMIPGRVEITGNDSTGIQPGREIVEISAPSCVDGQYGTALARCKDGSIWAWGEMHDYSPFGTALNENPSSAGQQFTFRLDGASDSSSPHFDSPKRLLNVEAASTSPITKISQSLNHIVLMREDGSVSELGYIPMFDTQRLVTPGMYDTGDYGTIDYNWSTADPLNFDSMYRTNPVVVTNVPVNVKQVCAAPSFGALLTDAGEVWVWGQWLGQILPTPQKITSLSGITKIVAGNQYIIALDKQGRLWGVGINNDGVFGFNDLSLVLGYDNAGYREWQLADNGIFHTNAVRVAGVENVTDIFTGDNTTWSSQMYAIGAVSDDKPAGLAADPMDRSIQLVWSNYPAASSYNIYRSLNENAGYVAIGNSTLNTFTDQSASLQNGQNYYYYVTAVVNGVETAPSWDIVATPYPPPGPVQNLTALGSCNGFKLQWQAPTNALVSPIQSYVIMQSGVQLAELFADATNYYDDITATNTSAILYQVIARNSAGQATNTCTPAGSLPCEPAPYISANTNASWLGVVNNGIGSDKATLAWTGPATNGNWLFEGTEFDTSAQSQTITSFVQELSQADAITDPVAFWLWTNFSTSATNSLLGGTASVSSNLTLVVSTLNGILTNGVGVSNLNFMVYGVTNHGSFINSAQLRSATTNLFKTFPTGTNLVQLKRMLIDDYFGGNYFTRGGNWGDNLTGFRIHYRTLQYVNGRKLAKTYQQDVNLSRITYNHSQRYHDDESIPCCVYQYTWLIPQGAVCWASVSAMVGGQENEISTELGPQWADTGFTWQSALRAIPGDHQVYLDWNDDVSIESYDVYYSTNPDATNHIDPDDSSFWADWSPVPSGTNLTMSRCWHTGLTNGVTYYYTVHANDDFSSTPLFDGFASATVVPTNSLVQTNFSAYASAYDGMVLVEWKVPKTNLTDPDVINQTAWQFYVERKPAGTGDTNYQLIADSGFGLAFLDSAVTDGQSYTYRVTAYDTSFNRLQTLAVDRNTGLTQSTPSAANGLTLLPPVPGNGYVDLSWSPIRATRFTIKHSLSPNGPFDVVDNLDVQNAYQNAANTYRHVGLQNGVMHYYQIAATTPTGFEIDSGVLGVMPLATLAPLPPHGFQGTVMPMGTTNIVALSWNAQPGATRYQVFLQVQNSLTPLYAGASTACIYYVPASAGPDDVFTFAVRSVSSQGQSGDLAQTTVTNQPSPGVEGAAATVVLQVAGALQPAGTSGAFYVTGPTNLALSATVSVPGVHQVNFYSDGQLIGTANNEPYQMIWYQVPGGTHILTATALVQDPTGTFISGGVGSGTFSSDAFTLNVTVEPVLSAYQTSATDLQLPAPGLPITLSRSYTSRNATTNGILGVGWTAGWTAGSVTLSTNLTLGWTGLLQSGFGSVEYAYITDTIGHNVTVNLPNGQSIPFAPQLQYDTSTSDGGYASIVYADDAPLVTNSFQPFAVNSGTLTNSANVMTISNPDDLSYNWNNTPVEFSSFALANITYTGSDGTVYQFNQQGANSLTWLLTATIDRNGNSLNYAYDQDTFNLLSISNSCGRGITFNYVPTDSGNNVEVYDTISPQGNGNLPVVVYVISNNVMTEVHQLIDRTSGIYQTNTYAYGSDQTGAPQDYNLLTDVYDARGVRMLHNDYTNSTGDLLMQTSPGRTNLFAYNAATYQLTVQTATSTATNTAMVTSDSSGAISGATVPVSGTAASTTNATQCTYDSQGNLISQTDANGNTKTYTYDSQNRLIGQSDANGNSTSTQLDAFGQPTVSTDANGNQTVYIYDNNGNPSSVSDPSGTSTKYTYNLSTLDANGNVLVGWQEASENQTIPYVPYHIVTKNNYSLPNNSAGPIYGDLTGTSQEWDDNDGHAKGPVVTTTNTYDANGNRLTEVKTRTLTGGGSQSITDAYTYDAQNRVVMTVISAGGSEILAPQTNTVTYNALGKQAASKDAAGRVTTSIYDFNGSLIETEYPDKTVSRTSYDGFGRQEYVQDRTMTNNSGASTAPATHNIYDASGRVIRVDKYDAVTLTETTAGTNDYTALAGAPPQCKLVASSPGNLLTTALTFYDAAGQVQYTVDARGTVTQNQYDGAGRRTNVLVYTAYTFAPTSTGTPNPTGAYQSTSYTYDANGNQVTVTDAVGHTTTSVYDNANRVIEVDSPATSGGTLARKMYYDGLGRKLQETDEAVVSTAYTYDFRGLLLSVTLAAGTAQPVTTVYSYDELGNETNQVDAAGHTTVFRYDALGRRTGRTLPGGQSEGSYYDPLTGNLIYQTNFNGVVITNGYDVANRLTNSASVNGYRVSYGYNVTNGWRTNLVDASGTTAWRYNAVGQLTNKVVVWANGPVATLNYGYDALGSLTNLWSGTANGVTNAYQYDLLGRLTNVLANGSAAAGYGFDKVGNLQTMRYGNGVTNGYQYDAQNRLTNQVWKLNNTAVAGFAYTLGPTGNRTNLVETLATASRTYTWAYDYLYRLTGETISGAGTVNYGYDAVGNRTNRTSSISQLTNAVSAYTANDWLASDSYDANGSTTASSGNSYQYDALNHLTNANNGTILMTYDGDGNRASKKVGGTTTYYLLDDRNPSGYVQVLEEWTVTSTATNLARVYNYGLNLISQRVPNTSTNYFIYDGHGSTRALMDSGGNVVNTFAYDVYGTLIASNGLPQTAYLYCGQQYDSDLGMYLNRARYLNAGTGRFWTMDTYEGNTEDPLSLHKYLYCKDDPSVMSDPSGHDGDLGGLMISMSIGNSLQSMYDGGASAVGNAIQSTLFGVQAGQAINDILTGYLLDETGIGLLTSAYQTFKGYFQDDEIAGELAFQEWQEEAMAALALSIPDDQYGEFEVDFIPQCFIAGTPVITEFGFVGVENIKPGDRVWSWNEQSGEINLCPVLRRFVHRRDEIFKIGIGTDCFEVTGEHPFYVSNRGWTPAQKLNIGDELSTANGNFISVDSVESNKCDILVYNFEVETNHDYFVGEEGVLTHNVSAPKLRALLSIQNQPLMAAHHLVSRFAAAGRGSRSILRSVGIRNLDFAENGVALPRNLRVRLKSHEN